MRYCNETSCPVEKLGPKFIVQYVIYEILIVCERVLQLSNVLKLRTDRRNGMILGVYNLKAFRSCILRTNGLSSILCSSSLRLFCFGIASRNPGCHYSRKRYHPEDRAPSYHAEQRHQWFPCLWFDWCSGMMLVPLSCSWANKD